jgi:hypothetical protein
MGFSKQFVMAGYFLSMKLRISGSSTAVIAASENALFSNTLTIKNDYYC